MNKLYECCIHEQINKSKVHFSKTAVICLNVILVSIDIIYLLIVIVFINICIFHFILIFQLSLVISLFCHFISFSYMSKSFQIFISVLLILVL